MLAAFITASGQRRVEWARRFGVTASYLSELVNGNRTPSLELAVRIERATNGQVPATSWIAADIGADGPASCTDAHPKDALGPANAGEAA